MKATFKTFSFSCALFFVTFCNAQTDPHTLPFWNYKLSFEERVNDVVGRLTLEEKVSQVLNATPALKGFKRISLKTGESSIMKFELSPQDLSVVNEKGQVKGKLMISVGSGQPGEKGKDNFQCGERRSSHKLKMIF